MYNMYNSFFSIIVAAVLLFFAFFAFHGLNSWEDESEERFERRKGQVKRFLIERIGSAILAIAFFVAMMLRLRLSMLRQAKGLNTFCSFSFPVLLLSVAVFGFCARSNGA